MARKVTNLLNAEHHDPNPETQRAKEKERERKEKEDQTPKTLGKEREKERKAKARETALKNAKFVEKTTTRPQIAGTKPQYVRPILQVTAKYRIVKNIIPKFVHIGKQAHARKEKIARSFTAPVIGQILKPPLRHLS